MRRRDACLLLGGAPLVRAETLERFEAGETCMGTMFRIVSYAAGPGVARAAAMAAFARARELDGRLSDYKPDSELNRLCASGRAIVSADLFAVLEAAVRVSQETRGAFDVTVGPLVRLWRESRRTGSLPAPDVLLRARRSTGWRRVRLDRAKREVVLRGSGMRLDLGGIAKGYAADEMLRVLRESGLPRSLAAAGGDIAVGAAPPGREGWTVQAAGGGRVAIVDSGISTSGDSEQFVEIGGRRYSHIVDPRTGLGSTQSREVSVVAGRAMFSDAYATALCAMTEDEARRFASSRPDLRVLK